MMPEEMVAMKLRFNRPWEVTPQENLQGTEAEGVVVVRLSWIPATIRLPVVSERGNKLGGSSLAKLSAPFFGENK